MDKPIKNPHPGGFGRKDDFYSDPPLPEEPAKDKEPEKEKEKK